MKLSLAICFLLPVQRAVTKCLLWIKMCALARAPSSLCLTTTLLLFQLVAQAIVCSSIRFASLLAPPGR